jgi:CheY-like chemotaxis protein
VEQTPAPPPPQNTRKTILIVDDDPLVLKVVSTALAVGNYDILNAWNGPEAIRQAREHGGTIHLLLSDFQMPGMTGIELATSICKERPEMRVLLMSGFDGGMLILNEGWHFLAKPFIPSQLRAIVANLLNGGKPFNASVVT